MLRFLYIILGLLISTLHCSDESKSNSDDPYKKYRVIRHEIPLLTQEIIKLHLKTYGIQFFDAQQKEAEAMAEARNKAGKEHLDSNGEYCCLARAVPSWGLTTLFYTANIDNDPLTNMVYGAFNKTNDKNGNQQTFHSTQLTMQDDGSIQCYVRMGGYPYMWAKEYSQKTQL